MSLLSALTSALDLKKDTTVQEPTAKKSSTLTPESVEIIQSVAIDYDLSLEAAAEKLIKTGYSRLKALNKYAAKDKPTKSAK